MKGVEKGGMPSAPLISRGRGIENDAGGQLDLFGVQRHEKGEGKTLETYPYKKRGSLSSARGRGRRADPFLPRRRLSRLKPLSRDRLRSESKESLSLYRYCREAGINLGSSRLGGLTQVPGLFGTPEKCPRALSSYVLKGFEKCLHKENSLA